MSTSSLNEAQYAAVFHRKGPLLVLAGAGSGKTRVITERIAALVERDVPPDAVTAVTFTNKAAREMRERLAKRLGERADGLRICTFHALGLQMIRRHAEHVGRRPNLSVFAETEQAAALRSVLQDMALPADAEQVKIILRRISAAKNGMDGGDASLAAIRERYDALLTRMNAVDFDDLMVLPIRLLSGHDDVLSYWRERARHFLVDEYQDSSRVQYELVRLLVPPDGNLTVVGDDDQSIYGWRGAEVQNLFLLDRDYPGLTVIRLEENYRSTGHVLGAANSLIAHNSGRLGKQLRSNIGHGKPVRIWESANPEDEAERVAADIRARHASGAERWGDFSVLYRASYQARPIEIALREAEIPYHVSGGLSFFDRAEIQDVLAYLRLVANFGDDMAFMRAVSRPRRGIGDKALGDLGEFAHSRQCSLLEACLDDELPGNRVETLRAFGRTIVDIEHAFLHGNADEAFAALMAATGLKAAIEAAAADEKELERRLGNVAELERWWIRHAEGGGKLDAFLQGLQLWSDRDEDPGNQVRLMTVHAAKGLEFAHVYVVGMEDGSFPHRNAVEENRMEEERRLMYVAMTRARFRLTLSACRSRRRYGSDESCAPSPFLGEIDPVNLSWVDRDTESDDAKEEAATHMDAMRAMLTRLSS
jgi:ATP-dependent DNA helicase Rep